MRFEIGQSYEDIKVLLATLRGSHQSGRGAVIVAALLAVVFVALGLFVALQGLKDENPESRFLALGVGLFMVAFGAALLVEEAASVQISDNGISKTHAFPWLSWRIDRSEIYAITLVMERGWSLEIRTTGDTKRSLELDGTIREALASLYPEVQPYKPTQSDYRRWRILAAVMVAILASSAIVVWWLTTKGVLYWG